MQDIYIRISKANQILRIPNISGMNLKMMHSIFLYVEAESQIGIKW